jgi:hypothetical protein
MRKMRNIREWGISALYALLVSVIIGAVVCAVVWAARFEENVHVAGTISAENFTPPDGCIDNDAIEAAAGIAATKLEHQVPLTWGQPNTSCTDETRVIHTTYGNTGTIVNFEAGSIAACAGAATVTVDLKKNGTTCLSAVITLDSANSARVAEAGTLSVTTLADGDVLEVVIDGTAGGGTLATGVFCTAIIREDAS